MCTGIIDAITTIIIIYMYLILQIHVHIVLLHDRDDDVVFNCEHACL